MQRLSLSFGCLVACATAGSTPPEEQPAPDAPTLVDARPPIDAAVSDCASAATCQAAMPLGSVSGDTGNAKLSAMGHQAAWFRVRVTEDDSDVPGLTLRVAAKLTSPQAVDGAHGRSRIGSSKRALRRAVFSLSAHTPWFYRCVLFACWVG